MECVLGWERCSHSVFLEEPLESVDTLINKVLEGLVLTVEEISHFFLHLSSLLDEEMLLSFDSFVANECLFDNMFLELVELILEVVGPPFSEDNEIVKEFIFTDIELVVCLFFVAIEDLNERGSEISVLNFINGLDAVVVEVDHDVSVLVEMFKYFVFVVVELVASAFVLFLKVTLYFLEEEMLCDIEKTLLGSNDLFVVELVVVSLGVLEVKPFGTLALVELSSGIKNGMLELLELLKDLLLDLVVVVMSLVSIELLGEVRDGSPEVILVLLELILNDFSGFSCVVHNGFCIVHCLHFDRFADEFDAVAESVGCHGEGLFSCFSSESDLLRLFSLEVIHLLSEGFYEGIVCSCHLDSDKLELF